MLSPIEQTLLAAYYGSRAPGADMSSHWRDYSGQFDVRVDETGRLAAVGVGFGNCRWQGPVHRLFDAVTRASHLARLPHRREIRKMYGAAAAVARRMGLDPTMDVFRQACTAELLERSISGRGAVRRIVIIGDGYGVLGALLKTRMPHAQIVYVDLGRTLLFQAHHVGRAFPGAAHALIAAPSDPWPSADFVYCPSEHAAAIASAPADLAINIASMQEMSADVVASYFAILRRALAPAGLFYCCNRERKVMPGGEVSEFAAFPWRPDDRILLDERCPWHQYFFAARGRARVGGLPVPFLQFYDGPHRHRLAALATP
jgi:putative sugar O-methyltransferase